eukprot:6201265-Pleurochrysis_carterae.AAC.5
MSTGGCGLLKRYVVNCSANSNASLRGALRQPLRPYRLSAALPTGGERASTRTCTAYNSSRATKVGITGERERY